ncbi:hypothetical protein HMPREF1564_0605 [Providencia alcalifaciens R90-1475]|nr:hypothetical protein HMPREF1564_0605 [Providencia alcalifaciens R90-1475]
MNLWTNSLSYPFTAIHQNKAFAIKLIEKYLHLSANKLTAIKSMPT